MGGMGISLTDRQTDRTFTGRDAGFKGCRAQDRPGCRTKMQVGSGRIGTDRGPLFVFLCVFVYVYG
jgi:hypothetical protein